MEQMYCTDALLLPTLGGSDVLLGVPCLHLVNAKWMRGRQRGGQKKR